MTRSKAQSRSRTRERQVDQPTGLGGLFARLCEASGLPAPVAEYVFARPRRWRFDWAWVNHKIALEVEGGVWTRGRHTRGSGFVADMAKYNHATLVGWRVFRCTPDSLLSEGLDLVRGALGATAREEAQ